jgi:RNA recognition motif-containing protein
MEERKRVYVGNLNYETTKEDLQELFGQAGRSISWVKLVNDKVTGKPTGYGFIEFGTVEDAADAVKAFDGCQFHGRTLKVSLARPRQQTR